jgi:pantoate--beta-alanine ligase
MYPFGSAASVRVEVPGVSEPLEGALRPGHFAGVATVVTKLFNLIQPDIAVFGRKDYQQLLVIERLVEDLRLPIEIIGAPIQREASGLAMSSRNQYLTGEERAHAATIYATLIAMREGILAGQTIPEVERQAQNRLQAAGFEPDYAVVRRAVDLLEPGAGRDSGLIALIAARLGRTRLIDNLPC